MTTEEVGDLNLSFILYMIDSLYLVSLHMGRFDNISTIMRINFIFWFTALCLSGRLFFYQTYSSIV